MVWDGPPDAGRRRSNRLKPISACVDTPPMRADLRRLVDWVAAYTLSPPGEVLAMALRVNARGRTAGGRLAPRRAACRRPRLTDARAARAGRAGRAEPRAPADLARVAEASAARGARHGRCRAADRRRRCRSAPPFDPPGPGPSRPDPFARAGPAAGGRCAQAVRRRTFSVTLLDGVTGSGKTEVYLEAVAECLRSGRQALVLLPEIALSSQWLERFERRFGVAPAVWHSDLSSRTRRITWRAVAEGAAPVVVGARSALFLPFPDLGLIVVDEEHETAFKQEDGVVYHARDMAVVRARLCDGAGGAGLAPRPAWRRSPTWRPAATAACTCPRATAAPSLPLIAAIDLRDDAAGPRPLPRAAPDRGGPRDVGARRAGDAVPQPPRLRAADAVPRLRPPHAVPELHRLAGGAPRPARPAMPPLRPHRADPRRPAPPAPPSAA